MVLTLALLTFAAGAAVLLRHRAMRTRLYRELAGRRATLMNAHEPGIRTPEDPTELSTAFLREGIVRVEGFLSPESLEELCVEVEINRHLAERSYIPGHKKGGTLSYEGIHRRAPACLAFYHSPLVRQWLSDVVGEPLMPTADHDQSSCSILFYDRPGDHIHWHYDYNFYRGRHFTVLLSLKNGAAGGGVSAGRLMQRRPGGEEVEWDTSENVLVMFEGARVFHRATPIAGGEERVMLSMTLCTDARIHPLRELARRIKDTAYYGPRALVD
jgi:hypothetical protein